MLKQLELKQLQDREQSKRELGDSKAAEDDTAKAALTVKKILARPEAKKISIIYYLFLFRHRLLC